MIAKGTVSTCCEAKVVEIRGNKMLVSLGFDDSCRECAMSVLCDSGRNEFNVTVTRPDGRNFAAGERVLVSIASWARALSVVLFLVMPCVLLVGVAAVLTFAGMIADRVAIWSIGCVITWFALLYAFRGALGRFLKWRVVV